MMAGKTKSERLVKAMLENDTYPKKWELKRKVRGKIDKVTVEGKEFTMKDLSSFFKQIRGFPTILHIGGVYGEGQSGGKYVTQIAHEVENKFVKKYGVSEYQKKMDKLMRSV
jgi:hypothetical protein